MKEETSKRRVVLTRSKAGNQELSARLTAMGIEPVSIDSMEFSEPDDWEAIDESLRALGSFDWLLFTSSNGVRMFAKRANELSLETTWNARPKVAAVGEPTAKKLRSLGIPVAFVPSEYLTQKLGRELPEAEAGRPGSILILRADIADPGLVRILRQRHFDVTEHAVYRTSLHKGNAAHEMHDVDAIIFASPSAVAGFASLLGPKEFRAATQVLAVCIGPVTSEAARQRGFSHISTPTTHTFDGLLDQLQHDLGLAVANQHA